MELLRGLTQQCLSSRERSSTGGARFVGLFGTRDGMIHRLSWRYLHSWWGIQIVGQNKRLGHFHVTIKKKSTKK